jgi:hypothetical protein
MASLPSLSLCLALPLSFLHTHTQKDCPLGVGGIRKEKTQIPEDRVLGLDFIPSKRIPQQDFLDDALMDAVSL